MLNATEQGRRNPKVAARRGHCLGSGGSKHKLCPGGTCICLRNTLICRKHSMQPHRERQPRMLPGNHTCTQQEPATAGITLVNCDLTEIHICAAVTGNFPQNRSQISESPISPAPNTECSHTSLTLCLSEDQTPPWDRWLC